MWLIGFLPDSVFYALLILGLLGIIASIFLRNLPIISKYHNPLFLLGLLMTVVGVWFAGGIAKDREYRERIAALQLEIVESEKRAAEANAEIEYVYVDRVEVVEKVRYQVVGSIREYSNELDANCTISPKAVEILNRSADALTKAAEK